MSQSPSKIAKTSDTSREFKEADSLSKIKTAILYMRSVYPTEPNALSFDLIMDPFLAHVMGRRHTYLDFVLTLVDDSLWHKLVKSARLVISGAEYRNEIEGDMYRIIDDDALGSATICSVISRLVSEVTLPLLFKLFPTRFVDKALVIHGQEDFSAFVKRYVDEASGIDFCTLTPVGEDGDVSQGWARYFQDAKKRLPTKPLSMDF